MTKRFKNYKRALELLRNPATGVGGNPPTDSALDNYKKWRGGETEVNYPRDATSKQGEILEVSVHPFGLASTSTALAIVGFSKRVSDNTALSNVQTACNHSAVNLDAHGKRFRFKPAKAVVFLAGTQLDTEVASKITGVRYNPREGASYTFPYGQATGKVTEGEVRTDILAAVNAITDATVSFQSENF